MTTSHPLTGDFASLLGGSVKPPRHVVATLSTNLPAGIALIDLDANEVRLDGPVRIDLDDSLTFSLSLIATNSTGINVTDGSLRYKIDVVYYGDGNQLRTLSSGWFELTAAADLSDKMGGAGDLDVTVAPSPSLIDAATAANINNTNSQSREALDVLIDAKVAAKSAHFFYPETYGAVGNGVANDTAAIQAAIDAAHNAGGGVVVLSKRYGWSGDLIHKGAVTVQGVGTRKVLVTPDNKDRGLVALAASARYCYGQWGGGSVNDNPGPLRNLVIDGNNVGGTNELVIMRCVDGHMEDVYIVNSAGNGLEVGGSQNSTLDHCFIGYHSNVAIRLINNDGGTNGQGAGCIRFNDCYITDAAKQVFADASDSLNFWPHEILFTNCLFEQRRSGGNLIHLQSGEFVFRSCIITYSLPETGPTFDCLVRVENPTHPTVATRVTFDSTYFNGGGAGVGKIVHDKSSGNPNEIRLYGRCNVTDADYIIEFDGSALGTSATASIDGAVYRAVGVAWASAVSGGTVSNLRLDTATPRRWTMPTAMDFPIQVRRDGDGFHRGAIDRDGAIRWYDGANGTLRGSVGRDVTGRIITGGQWEIGESLYRKPTVHSIGVGGAIVTDPTKTSTIHIEFQANGTLLSNSFNPTPNVVGQELRIGVKGNGTNTMTWPGSCKFAGGSAPAITNGQWTFVNFVWTGAVFAEVGRAVGVPAT